MTNYYHPTLKDTRTLGAPIGNKEPIVVDGISRPHAVHDDYIAAGYLQVIPAPPLLDDEKHGEPYAEGENWVTPVVKLTPEELAEKQTLAHATTVKQYERAIQGHLDRVALSRGYGNEDKSINPSVSARSYTGFLSPFQDECIAFAKWSADCWSYAYQQLAAVEAGERTAPTIEEFIAELPEIVW